MSAVEVHSDGDNVPQAVPTVDISGFESGSSDVRARISSEVRAACEGLGFLTVTGHGIAGETVASCVRAARPRSLLTVCLT